MSRTSIIDHQARARERLANLTREVRLHARTGRESVMIDLLVANVRDGSVSVRDAHRALSELRYDQRCQIERQAA